MIQELGGLRFAAAAEDGTAAGSDVADRGSGTGSNPPAQKGWQRNRRHALSSVPFIRPCVSNACLAYSEHEGMKRQLGG